jgi:hypothetical protein
MSVDILHTEIAESGGFIDAKGKGGGGERARKGLLSKVVGARLKVDANKYDEAVFKLDEAMEKIDDLVEPKPKLDGIEATRLNGLVLDTIYCIAPPIPTM